MYAAKRLGRNQVRSAEDPTVAGVAVELGKSGSREELQLWGVVDAFSTLIAVHDPGAGDHSEQVAGLSMKVAVSMNLPPQEVRMIGLAARVCDIGKVSIPNEILLKPSSLSMSERSRIHGHPAVGADVLARIPALAMLAPIIKSHHEHWDGAGYPDGIAGDAIPIGARIIAVCDAYCAMTAWRPFSPAHESQDALTEIAACAGLQFDPGVVDALQQALAGESEESQQALAS